MKRIGFITGIEKEAIILRKTHHYSKSKISWVGNKQGNAYTQANTLVALQVHLIHSSLLVI